VAETEDRPPLTAAQRRLRAGIAGATRSSKQNADVGKTARAALFRRFENEVDPDGVLDEIERKRRAKAALRAHMLRMSFKASRARQAQRAAKAAASGG
jgi:hypothetical protein